MFGTKKVGTACAQKTDTGHEREEEEETGQVLSSSCDLTNCKRSGVGDMMFTVRCRRYDVHSQVKEI